MQERTVGVVGGLARKEIGYLYYAILVEKLGLKDLNGERLNIMRPREARDARSRTEGSFAWWRNLRLE